MHTPVNTATLDIRHRACEYMVTDHDEMRTMRIALALLQKRHAADDYNHHLGALATSRADHMRDCGQLMQNPDQQV